MVYIWYIKGEAKKTSLARFRFPHILVRLHRIFKILVPTPHNYGCIIGGRDKNFKDLIQSDQDIRKTKYGRHNTEIA